MDQPRRDDADKRGEGVAAEKRQRHVPPTLSLKLQRLLVEFLTLGAELQLLGHPFARFRRQPLVCQIGQNSSPHEIHGAKRYDEIGDLRSDEPADGLNLAFEKPSFQVVKFLFEPPLGVFEIELGQGVAHDKFSRAYCVLAQDRLYRAGWPVLITPTQP